LTKLQPHFLTPWLFQSWNLSYNVSVESDRVKDKYFYISRGIELLGQGERLNRDNPDMRFWIGFYFLNKFGVSDERNTLRSLLQMSAIDPAKRDPNLLRPPTAAGRRRSVDLTQFEQFCRDNPQLVRRLRDTLRCNSPDDVVDFLAENQKLPTRFVEPESGRSGELKPIDQQFPVLPATRSTLFGTTAASHLGDSFCNYHIARTWFAYSLDPMPAPEFMSAIKSRAERLAEPGNKGKRMPRQPAEVIFRQYPARSQSFIAERLQQEGWFDESGWRVDQGRSGRGRWFEKDLAVGDGEAWTANAWEEAYKLWRTHGEATGIYLDPTTEERMNELARRFREHYNLQPGDSGENIRLDLMDKEMAECAIAHRKLFFREQNKGMTNFMHHFVRAATERDRDAVQARKLMFEAERLRNKENEPDRAIEAYNQAFALWMKLLSNPQYSDFRHDPAILESTYEVIVKYLSLVQQRLGPQIRPAIVVSELLRYGAGGALGGESLGSGGLLTLYSIITDPKSLPIPVLGPMDGEDAKGLPWIPQFIIREVRTKLNLDPPPPPPPQQPPGGQPPQPGP
jgi:hypothetical protein